MKVFTPNRLELQFFENDFASRQVVFSQGSCKSCCVLGQSVRRNLLTKESRLHSWGFAVWARSENLLRLAEGTSLDPSYKWTQ
jgi:hypothetical protein